MNQKHWFDDPKRVQEFGEYLYGKGIITSTEEFVSYLRMPQIWNAVYEQLSKELEQSYLAKKPKQTRQWFDERFYPINGDYLESITTILSAYPAPWLVQLISNIGAAEAEIRKTIAGERGSNVHDALQKNTVVEMDKFDDEEWLSLIHAKFFLDRYKPATIINEEWVWSIEHHFAGRIDRFVYMNKKNTLIDWKTGYVSELAWLQLAAEKLAMEEMHGLTVERWGIVGLNTRHKEGWKYYDIEERKDVEEAVRGGKELEVAIAEAYQRDIAMFHHVHAVWKHAFEGMRPRRYPMDEVPEKLDLSTPSVDDRQSIAMRIQEKIREAQSEVSEITVTGGKITDVKLNTPEGQDVHVIEAENGLDITLALSNGSETKVNLEDVRKKREEDQHIEDLRNLRGVPEQSVIDKMIAEHNALPTKKEKDKWRAANKERIQSLSLEDMVKFQLATRKQENK